MLAIQQKISHKRQSRRNVGFLTASNQNEGLTRMTDFPYTSIIWLTQGKFAIVDNDDYEHLSQWKWHFDNGYAKRQEWIPRAGYGIVILMHRVVADTPLGMHTDHIDGNKIDNRKSNLRACLNSQNQGNQRIRLDNKSGFKGVSWHKIAKKWVAQIKIKGKNSNLGLYENPVDAAKVYDEAAIKYHGEFAKTNKKLGLLKTTKTQEQ